MANSETTSISKHIFTLPKSEHLCSEKEIGELFTYGTSFIKYPLRIIFLESTTPNIQILTSVPKKRFKHAVDRNRIKRLIREAYRLNKHIIDSCKELKLNIAFVYIDTKLPTFEQVQKAVVAALLKIDKHYHPIVENEQ